MTAQRAARLGEECVIRARLLAQVKAATELR